MQSLAYRQPNLPRVSMRESSHDLVAAKAARLQRLAQKAAPTDVEGDDDEPVRSEVFRAWNN